MSHYMKETDYGPRALQIQWLNTIVTTHGMICSCSNAWKHLEELLQSQDIKCHFIGEDRSTKEETTTDGAALDENIDPGDLEKLFEQDDIDAETW